MASYLYPPSELGSRSGFGFRFRSISSRADGEEALFREQLLVVAQDALERLAGLDDAVHLLDELGASDALGAGGFNDLRDRGSLRSNLFFGLRHVRLEDVSRFGGETFGTSGLAGLLFSASIRSGRRSGGIRGGLNVFLGHRSGWLVLVML